MTDLRNFDLNLLICFDQLMRELSVTRAAERMFVTQSTMSHMLNRLRQQLDDPLLVRTREGMKPTARALALIGPVRAVLKDIEQLVREPMEFSPRHSQRRFVIHATDYIETLILPMLMERVGRDAPGVNIHFKRTDASFPERELERGELDLVIGFEAILKPPGYLHSEHLFDDHMVCVVSENHPSVTGGLTLEQYVTLPHMLISRTGTNTGVVDEWLAEHGYERRIALVVSHFLSAPLIVAGGDLVLSFPNRMAERFTQMAPLRILPIPIALPSYRLVMIWHPLTAGDPGHQWLRSQLTEIGRSLRDNAPACP